MKLFRLMIPALIIVLCCGLPAFCDSCEGKKVLDLTALQQEVSAEDGEVGIVLLRGKLNHFGIPDYHATAPGVAVWIAESPSSRDAGVASDETGWWEACVKKYRGADLEVSLVYEKPGWVTTKSNVITVADADMTDLAIQYIDPEVYHGGMEPLVQGILTALSGDEDVKMNNAVVATVGKSFASMHDDRLPHGDPGATVTEIPDAVGPVYFDKSVMPNPEYHATSVDGGVAWLNVPPGEYVLTAQKKDIEYEQVKFVIDEKDAQAGIVLYIASPPYSIQGTNDSAPGKD